MRTASIFPRLLLLPLLLPAAAAIAAAGDPPTARQSFSVLVENDKWFGTDRYYTNGLSLAWSESHAPSHWLLRLADRIGYRRTIRVQTHGFELAQLMSTPANTQLIAPQPADRPWAGLLYLGPTLQLDAGRRLDILKLYVGVTGSWSLADRTQAQWHRLIGVKTPKGWANQLPAEPQLNLILERRWRTDLTDPADFWNIDTVTRVGMHLGTIADKLEAGLMLRAGCRIPRDYGAPLIGTSGNLPPPRDTGQNAGRGLGAHAFVGLGGSAVARDVFLDGTLFHDSPRVSRENFTTLFSWGFAVTSGRFRAAWTNLDRSREFSGQLSNQKYSSISLAVFW